jgi:uncharacterized cupredoxin-like copper-binding protein
MGIVALALLVVVAVGCEGGRPTGAGAMLVRVTERDFHISAPKRVRAGDLRLSVRNRGPDSHELILVRLHGARLPLRSDGLTVDEDAFERSTVGVLEPGEPGSTRELRVHLAPGGYELLCNMAGHYLGGMRALFVAR